MASRRTTPVRLADGRIHSVDPVWLADPGVVDAFSLAFLRGDPATALAGPTGAVLTEPTARLLFGDADAMGRTFTLPRDDVTLTVTGVVAEHPDNTLLDFGVLLPFELLPQLAGPDALTSLTDWNYLSFVVLDVGADARAAARRSGALITEVMGYDGEDEAIRAALLPLTALRFDERMESPPYPTRSPRVLWLFGAIAVLILLVACVNFTNLATARATQRAREVGVRTSLGSGRGSLVAQFLGESVFQSGIALGVAFMGVALALPLFNGAMGVATAFPLRQPLALAGLVAIGLGAGVLAGVYPALVLTRFDAARVLKGELGAGSGGSAVRKGLVVFQFAVSAFLIVATLTVVNQLRFMRAQDLGFAQEQVVTLEATPEILNEVGSFRRSLLADPAVVQVAMANGLPGRTHFGRNYLWPGAEGGEDRNESLTSILAGPEYLETVGLELAAGRWFRDGEADVQNAYVLNETAVRELGLEDPVGSPFRAWDGDVSGTVIGVVKDFHVASLQQAIEPLVLAYDPTGMADVAVRFAPGSVRRGIAHLQETFARAAPGYTLDYRFLDEDFEAQYLAEARLSTLLGFFAGVAVFIACLGIFGLAALAAQRRRKEIGVRKVLGASVQALTAMLATDFVQLVALAFAIAAPLAYLAMSRWLEGFAYASRLGPGVFVIAGVGVLLLAMLTVSTQALRAATADPIRALRSD